MLNLCNKKETDNSREDGRPNIKSDMHSSYGAKPVSTVKVTKRTRMSSRIFLLMMKPTSVRWNPERWKRYSG